MYSYVRAKKVLAVPSSWHTRPFSSAEGVPPFLWTGCPLINTFLQVNPLLTGQALLANLFDVLE